MGDEKWLGLHLTRTCAPEATYALPSGRVRRVPLTKTQLLRLIKDAAHALDAIEDAERINRAREAVGDEQRLARAWDEGYTAGRRDESREHEDVRRGRGTPTGQSSCAS